tara:strand:- start:306 stop:491 length:186 start_codon:yes stop_codon:yes gene_type:complete
LRRSAFDIGVTNSLILDMLVKLGLEFMTVVGADFLDAKREFFDDMINKVNRVSLCVFEVNF